MSDEIEEKIFFVMGVPKSGTTWVQMLLAAHPEIQCRSEDQFSFFSRQIPNLLDQYNRVIKKIDQDTARQDQIYQYNEADAKNCMKFLILRALLKGTGGNQNIQMIGTKDNGILNNVELFKQLFPKAKFVNVIRDPRDIAVSSWFHNLRVEENFTERAKNFETWCHTVARLWKKDLLQASNSFQYSPERIHWIKYEDLHTEPAATSKTLFDFLQVSTEPTVIDQALRETDFTAVSFMNNEKGGTKNPFFRKGMPGDWKNHIDAPLCEHMKNELSDVMAFFKYE